MNIFIETLSGRIAHGTELAVYIYLVTNHRLRFINVELKRHCSAKVSA